MPERAPRRQTKTTGRVAVDRVRLGREALELDVARAGDPARLVLVGLAHVDQLDLAALERGADLVGVDVDVVGVEGVGHANREALRPRAARLRPGPRLVRHEAVSLARPRAQQRPRVARVDDLLDAEALGRAERRAHRVEPRLDLRPQRDRVLGRLELAPVGRLEPARDRQRAPVARRPRVAQVQPRARRRARRPRRRRPCARAPTPTAPSPGGPRTARARRGASCPRARPRCRSRTPAGRRG